MILFLFLAPSYTSKKQNYVTFAIEGITSLSLQKLKLLNGTLLRNSLSLPSTLERAFTELE